MFQVPQSLSHFHFNAVIPILMCIANTLPNPNLCHTTLCVLREVSHSFALLIYQTSSNNVVVCHSCVYFFSCLRW